MSHESASKRVKINDKEPASVAAQSSVTTTTELPVDPKTWTIDHVYQWVVDIVKVKPEYAQKLRDEEITGDVLS